MSGVARSVSEPEDSLDWKRALCGAEDVALMLGPWRNAAGNFATVTRCRDWGACASRRTAGVIRPPEGEPI